MHHSEVEMMNGQEAESQQEGAEAQRQDAQPGRGNDYDEEYEYGAQHGRRNGHGCHGHNAKHGSGGDGSNGGHNSRNDRVVASAS